MAATRKQVMALASKLGCEVTEHGYYMGGTVYFDAPTDHTFACSAADLHTVCGQWWDGSKPAMWADLLKQLRAGLKPCPRRNVGCVTCDQRFHRQVRNPRKAVSPW